VISAAMPTCDNLAVKNPVEPTEAEIRAWAYDADSLEPIQDWDLIIWGGVRPGLLVELTSDSDCPRRSYFLRCLYGRIGDEVRAGRLDAETWAVVDRSINSDDSAVSRWAARSATLRNRPELFEYEDWCGGELARTADPWPPSGSSEESQSTRPIDAAHHVHVEDLKALLADHMAQPFPPSVSKGADYGEVNSVLIGPDIYGWASRVAQGATLLPEARRGLTTAQDELRRSLCAFPQDARPYYQLLIDIADAALAL
jgi:hypothetical protein